MVVVGRGARRGSQQVLSQNAVAWREACWQNRSHPRRRGRSGTAALSPAAHAPSTAVIVGDAGTALTRTRPLVDREVIGDAATPGPIRVSVLISPAGTYVIGDLPSVASEEVFSVSMPRAQLCNNLRSGNLGHDARCGLDRRSTGRNGERSLLGSNACHLELEMVTSTSEATNNNEGQARRRASASDRCDLDAVRTQLRTETTSSMIMNDQPSLPDRIGNARVARLHRVQPRSYFQLRRTPLSVWCGCVVDGTTRRECRCRAEC